MNTKKFLRLLAITFVVMSFAGCPSRYMPPVADTDTYAYIYSPADTLYLRFHTRQEGNVLKHETMLAPSNIAQVVQWYSGHSKIQGEVPYDSEYNDLHIRKSGNKVTSYVFRCSCIIVNGQTITCDHFPSRYYAETGTQTNELPYIEQVIDTLLIYYPESVVGIDDLQEHSIYNEKSISIPPVITIN